METSNQVYQAVVEILMQLPSILTMLGCSIVALIRWKRHPKVSLMIVIILPLMILHLVVFAAVFAIVRSMVGYEDLRMIQTYQTFVSVAYNVTLAILTAILLTTIFVQRKKSPEEPAPEHWAQAA
jgi:hypothetical protein